jgi:hypothetical protein
MKIRSIVMAGLAAGAVALALAACTGTALGEGQGAGQGAGQGYRGARYTPATEAEGTLERGYGRGQQLAQDPDDASTAPVRGALRETVDPASERTGRDVADVGNLATLSGTLESDGTEWFLSTADGRFLLHLGNAGFVEQTGLELEDGGTAVVKGLVDADEVSVVTLQFEGKTYAFRTSDGLPLWGGGGRGAGQGAGRGAGQGSGRYAGTGA